MSEIKQRLAAQKFVEQWQGKGYEKGQSQPFWLSLLRDVFCVEHPEQFISFEDQVVIDHTSFIDGYISETKVMIEQKSLGKSLKQAIKQSDGSLLTPFQQAKRYITELPVSKHPKYVVTCNFEEFYVYDMERPNGEPEVIKLIDLPKEYYRLSFLADTKDAHLRKEMEVSIKAGEIVGLIYDALLKQYIKKDCEDTLKSLNKLCVRLVFCLYAEDAEIFGKHDMFLNYLKQFETKHFRKALIDLFRVLDTEIEKRDRYLEPDLASFPYVNGGLFADEDIEIPMFTDEIRELLLTKASTDFNWSEISPTIFGAVFESTLNPQTRRSGGMHYTSIENIHKVIDPLFMNELNKEFAQICETKVEKIKNDKLKVFQEKLASLKFLDPACGSGNFLTETYISLRKLENDTLYEIQKGQIKLGAVQNPIKVSISQFYGIEINDFAVTVAKTALWIAESQMMKQTEDIVHMNLDFLPLKTYTNIVEANALRIDWETVVPKTELNYIMGNPPFVGMRNMTTENKAEMSLTIPIKKFKQLDYVACWYFKSAELIKNTEVQVAFVSSNSICQGEQAITMWEPLIRIFNLVINFAHQTFKWSSESKDTAAVHCVIIGFSLQDKKNKQLFSNGNFKICDTINQYLLPTDTVFIEKRAFPICNNLEMTKGAQLIDGGNFILGKEQEYTDIIKKYPASEKYIRKYYNAKSLINNEPTTYCYYLENCPPNEIKEIACINEAVKKVYEYRANNESPTTRVLKDSPSRYFQPQVPSQKSIVVPVVSSENRKYIPISFMEKGMVYTNALFFIDNASLYDFGILTSNVHMAWTRTVCGRLKSDYRYSNTIVYNNFIWCEPSDEQKAKIEKTAQAILDARAKYPECSLADLYDDLTMPPELRKAHQDNDKAVMEAYGFYKKDENGKRVWLGESETVAKLFELYKQKTKTF